MREIKFRAWDKENKTMRFFAGIFNTRPYVELSTFPQYESFPRYYDLEIMQYTGLKDKTGGEIYEGDILRGGIFKAYQVEWDDEDNGWNIKPYAINHGDFEIIGNIHENADFPERG